MLELIRQPWPWYIVGPAIGLAVPVLLILGNKSFGVSSNLRHICAACFPAKIPFFQYNWRKEVWNLFFAGGMILGGFIAYILLSNPDPSVIDPKLNAELASYGISNYQQVIPVEVMNWQALLTFKGFIMMVIGGFLVGFGTRYAGGCTSGHTIMGLSTLQLPSLIATCSFMAGGLIMANFIMKFILLL